MLNRQQAPGAVRSLRMNSPLAIARGARHMKQSRLQKIIYVQHSDKLSSPPWRKWTMSWLLSFSYKTHCISCVVLATTRTSSVPPLEHRQLTMPFYRSYAHLGFRLSCPLNFFCMFHGATGFALSVGYPADNMAKSWRIFMLCCKIIDNQNRRHGEMRSFLGKNTTIFTPNARIDVCTE